MSSRSGSQPPFRVVVRTIGLRPRGPHKRLTHSDSTRRANITPLSIIGVKSPLLRLHLPQTRGTYPSRHSVPVGSCSRVSRRRYGGRGIAVDLVSAGSVWWAAGVVCHGRTLSADSTASTVTERSRTGASTPEAPQTRRRRAGASERKVVRTVAVETGVPTAPVEVPTAPLLTVQFGVRTLSTALDVRLPERPSTTSLHLVPLGLGIDPVVSGRPSYLDGELGRCSIRTKEPHNGGPSFGTTVGRSLPPGLRQSKVSGAPFRGWTDPHGSTCPLSTLGVERLRPRTGNGVNPTRGPSPHVPEGPEVYPNPRPPVCFFLRRPRSLRPRTPGDPDSTPAAPFTWVERPLLDPNYLRSQS